MRKLLVILGLTLALCAPVQADTTSWTEVTVTVFDQIDGDFAPRLTGAVVNFNNGKGIGAFLGQDEAIGPIAMWRVWQRSYRNFTFSIYTLAATDVSQAGEAGLWSNGVFGLEPRLYWSEFGNAEVGIGLLSARFEEGEKADWFPYFKLAFRPL